MQNQSLFQDYKVRVQLFDSLDSSPDQLLAPGVHLASHSPEASAITELHYHDGLEFGFCRRGAGVFIVDGEVFSFCAPCASILLPGQIHRARSIGTGSQWEFLTLAPWLKLPNTHRTLAQLLEPVGTLRRKNILGAQDELVFLLNMAVHELSGREQYYLQSAMGLLESALCQFLRRTPAKLNKAPGDIRPVAPVLNYISQNYRQDISVDWLARQFHLSQASLRRQFESALGISPLQYLHRVRISTACSLLQSTSRSILEISLMVGYASQSSFNRQFQKLCGESPSAFRSRKASPREQEGTLSGQRLADNGLKEPALPGPLQ